MPVSMPAQSNTQLDQTDLHDAKEFDHDTGPGWIVVSSQAHRFPNLTQLLLLNVDSHGVRQHAVDRQLKFLTAIWRTRWHNYVHLVDAG